MGLLENADMLRVLSCFIFLWMAIFRTEPIYPGFFEEEKVDFFGKEKAAEEKSSCPTCGQGKANSGNKPAGNTVKNKAESIQKTVQRNFQQKEYNGNKEILLFIDPDCPYSDGAVKTLMRFKKKLDWQVKGVVVTGIENLKETLLAKKDYFSQGIDFNIDTAGNLIERFGITKVPSFVINMRGRCYKIAGQPDLEGIIKVKNNNES